MPAAPAVEPRPMPAALSAFKYLFPGGNYGVVVLAAAALGTLAGAAGHSFVLGCFTDAIMEELELPRSTVATCFMISLVTSSLYANVVGAAADRVGARVLISVAALPYAVAVASLSFVTGARSLQVAMLSIRMLGPETIDFACRLCVNQWWVARRGVAVGVLNMVGAFQSTLPAMIAVATRELGWRATLRAMAVMMGSAALGLSALLLQRPEDVGLRPDGADPSAPALPSGVKVLTRAARARAEAAAAAAPDSPAPRPLAHTHEESATEHELSVREAVRTTGFWLLFLYYLLCGGSWNALNFWMGSLLAELAAEVTSASARSLIYVPLAVASAAAALVGGVLVDRLRVPHKQLGLAAPTVCLALCLAAFGSGRKVHAAQLLAVGVGLGCYQGFDKTIPPVVAASLFGRRNNGRIEAVFLLTRQLSGAVGVQVLGAAKEAAGSSRAVLTAAAATLLLLVVTVVATTATRGRRPAATGEGLKQKSQ